MRTIAFAFTTLLLAAARATAQGPATATTPDVERRVDSLLRQMTLEEKVGLIGGVNGFDVPGLARLHIPQLGTADSPFGVRADGPSTVYAGGIGLAATWDPALAERVGTQLGRDARARGKAYSLGPGVNIYRAPLNGRNFEYYGEDPFLGSRIAVGFIRGTQSQGVSSTVKHFMGNNSEFGRNTTDSRIDERTMREIYLPIFEAAVKEAQVGAVMDAYNLVNGAYMTANHRLNVDLVKSEWGFPGVMMSDWGAVHSTLDAANGGTDLEMPGPQYFNRDSLLPLVRQGRVTQATIDDKVRRLLRTAARFGWLDRPQLDPSIPRYNAAGRAAALQAAREGMVLLKNDGAVLPLDRQRIHTVAVIGPNAHPAVILGGGSATVPPFHAVSALEGMGELLGTSGNVLYARGLPSVGRAASNTNFMTARTGGTRGLSVEVFRDTAPTGQPSSTRVDQHVVLGAPLDLAAMATSDAFDFSVFAQRPGPIVTRWTGWYSATAAGTYDFAVQQGGFSSAGYRLYVDDKLITDRWSTPPALLETTSIPMDAAPHKVVLEHRSTTGFGSPFARMAIVRQGAWADSSAIAMAAKADAVVLVVGFDASTEGEAWDRTFALPAGQDDLIERVIAANPHTVVVINSGGAVDMRRWIDRAPAVLQAWYPGELGGTALAEIVFGTVNPSGHLPATFERRWEDNPVHDNYYPTAGTNRIEYREGVFVGYRGYDKSATKPLFPFGHGLSYTTFTYGKLSVAPAAGSSAASPRWDVSLDVTNSGTRAGDAVAQLYVGDKHASVPRPAKELKGFMRVTLQPGETRRVSIPLDVRSLAYYDIAGKQWRADAGTFELMAGGSSDQLSATGTLTLARTVTVK